MTIPQGPIDGQAGGPRMSLLAEIAAEFPAASSVICEGGAVAVNQEALRGDPALVRRIVEALPNTTELFPVRERYRDIGYAIKASLGDTPDAFDLFWSWCQKWPGNENGPNTFETVESDWRRMKPPFKRGFRYLAEQSHEYSAGAFDIGELWFEKQTEPLFPAGPDEPAPQRRFVLQPFDVAADAYDEDAAEPLVEDLLDQGAMSVLYGESNSGKTFVALAIAYAVAAGIAWGRLTTAQGAVVYVSAEGGRAVKRRLQALKRKHGTVGAFFILPETVDLFQPDADVQPLVDSILALGTTVRFVVVDTLARAMAGGDENSTKDMSAFVKNVDRIRAATGCHLMLVHHSGKDASKGARGSSALRAATDTEIELTPGRMTVTKQRDMEGGLSVGFALEPVELHRDKKGKAVTSCTVQVLLDGTPLGATPMVGGKDGEVFRALSVLCGDLMPGLGVSVEQVCNALVAAGHTANKGAARSSLNRLWKARLVEKNAERNSWTLAKRKGGARDWFQAAPPDTIFS